MLPSWGAKADSYTNIFLFEQAALPESLGLPGNLTPRPRGLLKVPLDSPSERRSGPVSVLCSVQTAGIV